MQKVKSQCKRIIRKINSNFNDLSGKYKRELRNIQNIFLSLYHDITYAILAYINRFSK